MFVVSGDCVIFSLFCFARLVQRKRRENKRREKYVHFHCVCQTYFARKISLYRLVILTKNVRLPRFLLDQRFLDWMSY